MDVLFVVTAVASTAAALAATIFAWITVRDARAARREESERRYLERLFELADRVGDVGERASARNHEELAVAQLRLSTALVVAPEFEACRELTTADADEVFEVYLEARDEVAGEIERQLSGEYVRRSDRA